jgi:phosphohistidine phosphatase
MDLYMLRHGKAERPQKGQEDSERRLTAAGKKEIRDIARWMQREGIGFDLIASSPLVRARETGKIIARILGLKNRAVTWEDLAPGGDPETVCYAAAQSGDNGIILIIGHEPALSGLIGKIISRDGTAAVMVMKGGLARVTDFSFDSYPSGVLQGLLTAKQMKAMR